MNRINRVIVIDTELRLVFESVVQSLADMQRIVGGRIECATTRENGDDVFVNEEGLLNGSVCGFTIKGGHQPFMGNAFVIGSPDIRGNSQDALSTVAEIANDVKFFIMVEK